MMRKALLTRILMIVCAVFLPFAGASAQNKNSAAQPRSREFGDDGIPVLTKHLPDYENARNRATYILNENDLRTALGARQLLDVIDFAGGTEAVTAPYGEAKLLLVEFSSPQSSSDADAKIRQIAQTNQNPPIFYRRIGNYNAIVFDTNDEAAANALLDQIKYEKNIQWLGQNPFLIAQAERNFVNSTADLFVSTTLVIVGGLGLSVLAGIIVGFFFFRFRDNKRSGRREFSDAGGMTRLNLDGFTPQISPERMLEK